MRKLITLLATAIIIAGCVQEQKTYFGVYSEVPVSQIKPEGWFRELLETQRDGLGLHRHESGYPYNTCLWSGVIPKGGNPIAKDWWPYEQSGYIVDGLYRCGILLGDSTLINLGRSNVLSVVEHPRDDGTLGPVTFSDAQWAFSVFARAIFAGYDDTQDKRILDALTTHLLATPDSITNRRTCIIESMCKLYSITGDVRLLNKADSIWRYFSIEGSPDNEFFRHADMVAAKHVEVHGVTAAEVSKQPAILYLYTGKKEYLDAAKGFYASVERDHELADGIPSSYEKLLGNAAEALHETCDVSDFMWSYGYMLMATGEGKWADKMENAFYNAALGSISKDFGSHQYFSSPNQIVATQYSSMADYGQEGLLRQAYRPGFDTECCSGNVHRMMPNYASRMWMRDNSGGIVATLYAPGKITAQVGKTQVTVVETTDYPFRGEIVFSFESQKTVKFPFTVRIPTWAEGATVSVNGKQPIVVTAGTFHTIDRKFRNGDKISLSLPMLPRKEFYGANGINVRRGPLLFSVDIAENLIKIADQMKTSEEFPAWDILPASPWNYALAADARIEVEESSIGESPWTPSSSPVKLRIQAYRVQDWTWRNGVRGSGAELIPRRIELVQPHSLAFEDQKTSSGKSELPAKLTFEQIQENKNMYRLTTPKLPAEGFETSSESCWITMVPSGSTRIRLTTLPVKR